MIVPDDTQGKQIGCEVSYTDMEGHQIHFDLLFPTPVTYINNSDPVFQLSKMTNISNDDVLTVMYAVKENVAFPDLELDTSGNIISSGNEFTLNENILHYGQEMFEILSDKDVILQLSFRWYLSKTVQQIGN